MLKHYIPEVQRIEEVTTELDEVSAQEFNTLEERLATGGAN